MYLRGCASVRLCTCLCVYVCACVCVRLTSQVDSDQSPISHSDIQFRDGHTIIDFATRIREFGSDKVIWAFCDKDKTQSLAFHGDNHA